MQFHSTRILLQQRFAFPTLAEIAGDEASSHSILAHISENARSVCATSAIRIAKLFETFRRKYDVRSIQSTGTQYASFAANALVKYILTLPSDEAIEPIAHLQSLSRTLQDMSKTFMPALKPLEMINRELGRFAQNIEWFDHDDSISIPHPSRPQHPHPQVVSPTFQQTPAELIPTQDRRLSNVKRHSNTRERLKFNAPSNPPPATTGHLATVSPPLLAANTMEWTNKTSHHKTNEWTKANDLNPNNTPAAGQRIFDSPEHDGNASLDGWEELLGTS